MKQIMQAYMKYQELLEKEEKEQKEKLVGKEESKEEVELEEDEDKDYRIVSEDQMNLVLNGIQGIALKDVKASYKQEKEEPAYVRNDINVEMGQSDFEEFGKRKVEKQ